MRAWVESGHVRDIAPGNPNELYHPDIAAKYSTEVPLWVKVGAVQSGNTWVNPPELHGAPEPAPAPPAERKVSPVEFKLLFTPQERVAIRAARETDPVIDDFFDILDDPRLTSVTLTGTSTRSMVDYLVSKQLLTASRRDEILG